MKFAQIKELNFDLLAEHLASSIDNLYKLKLTHRVAPVENSSQIRTLKRNIARMKFLLAGAMFNR